MKLKTKIITYVSSLLTILVIAIAFIVFGLIQPNRLEKLMKTIMLKVAGSIVYETGIALQADNSPQFKQLTQRLLLLDGGL